MPTDPATTPSPPSSAGCPSPSTPIEKASLGKNRSFFGMGLSQFLGAFNDNLFKQVAQLICVDWAAKTALAGKWNPQSIAMLLFAIPFVVFSGFAGYLSDRYSKQRIVVLCKVAEICVVLFGTFSLWLNSSAEILWPIYLALFLLGTHSAFYGPSKFGILPEIIQERQLPTANGLFLMTTFLAIILGNVAAGFIKEHLIPNSLLIVALFYVGVATLGLLSSLLVRKTPSANPALRINRDSLFISRDMLALLRKDRALSLALLMSSVFWLVGGVVQPSVNDYGKKQLHLTDSQTSLVLVNMVIGIAIGCVTGGWLSGEKANFKIVWIGAWGMIIGSGALSIVGELPITLTPKIVLSCCALFLCGLSAGIYAVPLQVFLQSRPPKDKKGQMIGAMNLGNWIAILASALVYALFHWLLVDHDGSNTSRIFGATALFLVPVALFYRPRADGRPVGEK